MRWRKLNNNIKYRIWKMVIEYKVLEMSKGQRKVGADFGLQMDRIMKENLKMENFMGQDVPLIIINFLVYEWLSGEKHLGEFFNG